MTAKQPSLATRVIELVENALRNVAAVANVAQVYTNYEIGRQIIEEEQGGKHRADYGKRILIDLSNKLTARFGRGWSVDNLQRMRGFYLLYSSNEIYATPLRKLSGKGKSATLLRKSTNATEPIKSGFQVGNINIGSVEISQNPSGKSGCAVPRFALSWSHYLKLMRIDDPDERRFYEIEAAENKWSLKERQDIGQMQMYVNHYDRKVKLPDENKTIGILLCADKDDAIVEMTLPEGDRQIFASKYRTILPSKAQLKALLKANGQTTA